MYPFGYESAKSIESAAKSVSAEPGSDFLAGGTTLLDLMKLDVLKPEKLVYLGAATPADVTKDDGKPQGETKAGDDKGTDQASGEAVSIGSGCRMAAAAEHELIKASLPVVRQSLLLAASPQIRNMASIGGNVLQRTRCPYFRDTDYAQCNKRNPGSGCAAIADGADNRMLAVLGTSDACIATFPGDFSVALVALDASLDITAGDGSTRAVKLRDFYKKPGQTPHIENDLEHGEVITRVRIPTSAAGKNSLYYKVRDRASYAFALASVAAGLELDGQTIKDARLALGGVGTVPWHAPEAVAALIGKPATEATFTKAAELAVKGATPQKASAFKVELAKRAVVAALTYLSKNGTPDDATLWQMQHGR